MINSISLLNTKPAFGETPKNATNQAQTLPEAKPDTFMSDIKTAKTAGVVASIVGLGSLAASLVVLKKASDVSKTAAPIVEKAGTLTKGVEKIIKETGLDNVLNFAKESVSVFLNKSGDIIKELGEIAKKINRTTDEQELDTLNGQFSKIASEKFNTMLDEIDKATSGSVKKAMDTPIMQIFKAGKAGKINVVNEKMNKFSDKVENFFDKLGKDLTSFIKSSISKDEEAAAVKVDEVIP